MSFWDEIDDKEYLPFAKFERFDKHEELYIALVDDEPSIFTNRWGKSQWSIRVWKYRPRQKGMPEIETSGAENDMFLLVGGVRLFREIKKEKEYEGILRIRRLGTGFQTKYKIIQKIDIK